MISIGRTGWWRMAYSSFRGWLLRLLGLWGSWFLRKPRYQNPRLRNSPPLSWQLGLQLHLGLRMDPATRRHWQFPGQAYCGRGIWLTRRLYPHCVDQAMARHHCTEHSNSHGLNLAICDEATQRHQPCWQLRHLLQYERLPSPRLWPYSSYAREESSLRMTGVRHPFRFWKFCTYMTLIAMSCYRMLLYIVT